jgi:WD40 repeat protein
VRLRRRFASQSRCRVAASVRAADAGASCTALAAHNSFRSPLAFVACSDRSVRALDMGAPGGPREVLRVPEAHARAVHALALPAASCFADVSAASLNCFLTASTDGPAAGAGGSGASSSEGASGGLLRLWDIRANRCARQLFGGHVNRVHACGAALSPCLTYAAVGSEDRCAVVYDLRTGRAAAKLRGAGDAVTSVAWSPLACTLAAGSLDGGVRFYAAP